MSNRKQMMLYAAGMTIATSGAWAQNQRYQAYTARSQAIQNNADASTNQALRTIQRAINKDKAQENAIQQLQALMHALGSTDLEFTF